MPVWSSPPASPREPARPPALAGLDAAPLDDAGDDEAGDELPDDAGFII